MIRKTLETTQVATWCICLPNKRQSGMPTPIGTGFFVSPDGYFVTAAHVITENNESDGPVRQDLGQGWLMREPRGDHWGMFMCQFLDVQIVLPLLDFALLKVDFEKNSVKDWLRARSGFPFLAVSRRTLDEGEPVYAFGYPLSAGSLVLETQETSFGTIELSPRVTSAIVSSNVERTEAVSSPSDPRVYVLDKALNYGNSGGPIVATESGCGAAFCSRFQPVPIRQPHLKDAQGNVLHIVIPSLYGVVVSLSDRAILDELDRRGVPVVDD